MQMIGRTLTTALVWLAMATAAIAETRVALVIGNSAYTHAKPLANPANDAADMAALLDRLGFDVTTAIDLKIADVPEKLIAFEKKLRNADVALLFFAGHGISVSGENYLIPVDARLEDAGNLDLEAVALSRIQALMERRPRTNILLFDACRDNPFAEVIKRSLGTRSALLGRGWAQVKPGKGTFISFATAPGDTAADGVGRNSPFTTALLQHLPVTGADVQLQMRDVRRDVIAATNGDQVPWEHSSLIAGFAFASATRGIGDKLIAADRPSFKRGETIKLTITPPKDCRLTLINVDKAGQSCLLFPHPKLPDEPLKAGQSITFPPKGALRLDEPGEETFVAMCNATDAARNAAVRDVKVIDCSKGAADRSFNDKVLETVTFDLDAPADGATSAAPRDTDALIRGSITVTVSE